MEKDLLTLSSPSAIWKPRLPAADRPAAVPESARTLPPLIQSILKSRGLHDDAAIQGWLSPSLKALRDPFVLYDMDKAVERLLRARLSQEPIVIYADYDLDGTSGLALLLKGLQLLGFKDVTYYQPKRLSEGYGLHNAAIQKLADSGRKLLLSVDLGITAIEETEFANALGMDVIITDHHLPKETLPNAYAVVNPNRGNCTSNLSHLCGTGVAFYLILALRRTLLEQGLLAENFDPKILLDCFTIGTVTDMVPLVEENRVLVKHGLLQLAQTKRPGLRVLMQALGLWGNPLTSSDVAIRFAPKLNALSRMEMGIQPIDLYLVEDENQAHLLVERVLSNNQDRQASQKNAESEAMRLLESNPPQHAIFVHSENFHRGVVGLVATRLCQEHGLPAFVGSLTTDDGLIVGSVRMPDGCKVSALDAMGAAAPYLEQFGGHAAAAGFELKVENADHFKNALENFFAKSAVQGATQGPRQWLYDAKATLEELNATFMSWYEALSPFGVQFATPTLLIQGVRIAQVKSLRGGHYRLTLTEPSQLAAPASHQMPASPPGQAGRDLNRIAMWFSPNKAHPVHAAGVAQVSEVDVLVEPQWNYFAGNRTLQLIIQDIRLSDRA
jgi:single-stranded-DNA-specific exonuclease